MNIIVKVALYSFMCLLTEFAIIFWTYTQCSKNWRIYVGLDVAVLLYIGIILLVQ